MVPSYFFKFISYLTPPRTPLLKANYSIPSLYIHSETYSLLFMSFALTLFSTEVKTLLRLSLNSIFSRRFSLSSPSNSDHLFIETSKYLGNRTIYVAIYFFWICLPHTVTRILTNNILELSVFPPICTEFFG